MPSSISLQLDDSSIPHPIIPPFLQPGDTIAIVATARWVTPEQLQPALDTIHAWGYKTKVGKHVHEKNFQLAGTDKQRTSDLQYALDDEEVKAILVARGGYGTARVVEHIELSRFCKKPKWICGYSDVTALHSVLANLGIASIHSTMPVSFHAATAQALQTLRLALCGQLREVVWTDETNSHRAKKTDIAVSDAILVGGNLSVLYSMMAGRGDFVANNTILFLEDVSEYLYHIDRMMTALRSGGKCFGLRAIVVGGLTEMKDNTREFGFAEDNAWGHTAEDTISQFGEELRIPVVFNFPAGHISDNRAFYLGTKVSLRLQQNQCTLRFQT